MNRNSASIGERFRHEVREFVPVALFFLIASQLLALTQDLMLREQGIQFSSFVTAAVGALIVAKVILIADHFSFVNRFPRDPLIYNVLWKTAIYFAGSVLVRYGEHLMHTWRQTGSFVAANQGLLLELNWPHLVCVQLWLLVLLFLYCSASELCRRLGPAAVFELFFGARKRSGRGETVRASDEDRM